MAFFNTLALPRDEQGRTYVSDQMLFDDPNLLALMKRTAVSWARDESRMVYFLKSELDDPPGSMPERLPLPAVSNNYPAQSSNCSSRFGGLIFEEDPE